MSKVQPLGAGSSVHFLAADDDLFDSEDEELAEAAIAEWLSGRGKGSPSIAGASSDSDASAQELQPSTVSISIRQAAREASADLLHEQAGPSSGPANDEQSDVTLADTSAKSPEQATKSLQAASGNMPPDSPTATEGTLPANGVGHGSVASKAEDVAQPAQSQHDAARAQPQEKAAPIALQGYASAAELEQLGLDELKQQLQLHGLKCGGSLTERAARLFLLRDTPAAELDKKHFPKGKK